MWGSITSKQLSIASSYSALSPVGVENHRNGFTDRFQSRSVLTAFAQTVVLPKNIYRIFVFSAEMDPPYQYCSRTGQPNVLFAILQF